MSKKLNEIIKGAGIVGAGGAGFPTHVKVDATADTLILNGAECEPLIRVDQQLMDVYAREICVGMTLMQQQLNAKRAVIGLKGKYKNAIASLTECIQEFPNVELFIMDNFYPAGDEQILVYEVTGRIVPEGGIPLNVGAVVMNVETILNVVRAQENNDPVTEKYVTVTGAVNHPITVKVPIGIKVSEALALAGGTRISEYAIINGGPMMGKLIGSDDVITKTTKSLIVLPKTHALIKDIGKDLNQMLKEAQTACMHCSLCTEVCPRNLIGHRLEPHKLIRMESFAGMSNQLNVKESAHLCCECRLCQYACVMNLMPWRVHIMLKGKMREEGLANTNYKQTPDQAHPFRDYKKFLVGRLIAKLDLVEYDVAAPLDETEHTFDRVEIPLRQHIGAPAAAVVTVGQGVQKGDPIGVMDDGKLGANVHASISGTVAAVTTQSIIINRSV